MNLWVYSTAHCRKRKGALYISCVRVLEEGTYEYTARGIHTQKCGFRGGGALNRKRQENDESAKGSARCTQLAKAPNETKVGNSQVFQHPRTLLRNYTRTRSVNAFASTRDARGRERGLISVLLFARNCWWEFPKAPFSGELSLFSASNSLMLLVLLHTA